LIEEEREVTLPPSELDGAQVQYWADVSTTPLSGAVRHLTSGVHQASFSFIAIAQYRGESSAYLFHCNGGWVVENDNCYESVADAMADAERQYAGFSRGGFRRMELEPRGGRTSG